MTDKLGLYKPDNGETGWGDEVNANADLIDERFAFSEHYNVKDFGALGDGVTDDTDAIQAALDEAYTGGSLPYAGRVVFFPYGDYFLADGSGLTIPDNVRVTGLTQFPGGVRITHKNATALTLGKATALEHIWIEARDGSTSGSGIETGPTTFGIRLEDVQVRGIATSTDPVIYQPGGIGNQYYRVRAFNGGGHGWHITTGGWFNNLNSMYECSGQSSGVAPYASMFIEDASQMTIQRPYIESGRGYGLHIKNGGGVSVSDGWFEDISSDQIRIEGGSNNLILHNGVFYNHGDDLTAIAINVLDVGSPSSSRHLIVGNRIPDGDASGTGIYIGTNNQYCVVMGLGVASANDNGTNTTMIGSLPAAVKTPEPNVTVTDSTTPAIDLGAGSYHHLVATNGVGASRTVAAPTNFWESQQFTIHIHNSTGGAITTAWNASYKLAGAWVDPANGKHRTITFRYLHEDGFYEVARSAADIA